MVNITRWTERATDFTCVVLDRVIGRPVFICAIGTAAPAALGHDGQVGHVAAAGSGGGLFRQAGADSPSTHYSRKQSSCLSCNGQSKRLRWHRRLSVLGDLMASYQHINMPSIHQGPKGVVNQPMVKVDPIVVSACTLLSASLLWLLVATKVAKMGRMERCRQRGGRKGERRRRVVC